MRSPGAAAGAAAQPRSSACTAPGEAATICSMPTAPGGPLASACMLGATPVPAVAGLQAGLPIVGPGEAQGAARYGRLLSGRRGGQVSGDQL